MYKKVINVFTVIISLIIGIIITVIVVQYSKYQFLSNITNGLYNENSIYFNPKNSEVIETIISELNRDDVLFCEINNDYRALYFNGEYKLPMKKGRFFNRSDLTGEKNYVVIGNNHVNNINSDNGKQIFSYGGIDFEVIGILGMDIPSPLDNMILFNLKNVKQYMSDDSIYVLSTVNKSQRIKNNPDITVYDVPIVGVHRIFDNKISMYVIMCICLLLSVYCLVILLLQHLKNQINKIKIYGILGFNYIYIAVKIFLEQMKYIIIPSALGIALPFLFTDKYYMSLKQVLVLLIINFIIIFLSILAIKIKVRSVLRRGVLYYYE